MRVLIVGFGRFPGVRDNPTARLIWSLSDHRARFARLGITIASAVLPVEYQGVLRELDKLASALKPEIILLFGLAARRKAFIIEARAANRLSTLRFDASRQRAPRRAICPGGAHALQSTFPYRSIEAAYRHARLPVQASVNAGDYICNEALYFCLARGRAHAVGFIHVPGLARSDRPKRDGRPDRPNFAALMRAFVIAVEVTARHVRGKLANCEPSLSIDDPYDRLTPNKTCQLIKPILQPVAGEGGEAARQ
ncbi:MAG TPA: hypothetical protein VEK34_08930 [Methylocella sp.]|nr:hypothetical protein [Methylocella sp.]